MTWCGWWCIICVQTNGAYIYDMNRVRKKGGKIADVQDVLDGVLFEKTWG